MAISGVRSKHVCMTWSRRTELNAFLMSGFTMTLESRKSILLQVSCSISYKSESQNNIE